MCNVQVELRQVSYTNFASPNASKRLVVVVGRCTTHLRIVHRTSQHLSSMATNSLKPEPLSSRLSNRYNWSVLEIIALVAVGYLLSVDWVALSGAHRTHCNGFSSSFRLRSQVFVSVWGCSYCNESAARPRQKMTPIWCPFNSVRCAVTSMR